VKGTLSAINWNHPTELPVNGKGFRLTRKRFQTGSVRLREDRVPVWWEGFYREDVITESGRLIRKRRSVKLGLQKDIPSESQAKRKLAQILVTINSDEYRPKSVITFCGFVQKYRELKMATKKGTTQHGYETNIRAHYLPHFGDWLLAEIDVEAVQKFLNLKQATGKSFNKLKNLKWGLSSIFTAAVKYGYVQFNPVRGADLPPEEIREQAQLPNHGQLNLLIENLPEPASRGLCPAGGVGIQVDRSGCREADVVGGARGQPRQSPHAEVPSHQSPHTADGGGRRTSADVEAAAQGEG
jgi:hypothetical protein